MRKTMYVVTASEAFIQECTAIFADQFQASLHADLLNEGPDSGGAIYIVVPISVDANTIEVQGEAT